MNERAKDAMCQNVNEILQPKKKFNRFQVSAKQS